MPATLPFTLVTLGLVLMACYYATRLCVASNSRDVSARTARISDPLRQPSLVRLGHIGAAASIGQPRRSTAQVAPPDGPDRALVVSGVGGAELVNLAACDVVMARAWSGGKLLVAFGEARRDYGPSWPKGPQIAGWELHLVTVSGEIVRCYGTPNVRLDADIERLRSRLGRALLPQAG